MPCFCTWPSWLDFCLNLLLEFCLSIVHVIWRVPSMDVAKFLCTQIGSAAAWRKSCSSFTGLRSGPPHPAAAGFVRNKQCLDTLKRSEPEMRLSNCELFNCWSTMERLDYTEITHTSYSSSSMTIIYAYCIHVPPPIQSPQTLRSDQSARWGLPTSAWSRANLGMAELDTDHQILAEDNMDLWLIFQKVRTSCIAEGSSVHFFTEQLEQAIQQVKVQEHESMDSGLQSTQDRWQVQGDTALCHLWWSWRHCRFASATGARGWRHVGFAAFLSGVRKWSPAIARGCNKRRPGSGGPWTWLWWLYN